MVKYYVMQIRMGKLTIDDVPKKWREAVQKALDEGLYMPTEAGGEDVEA